MRIAALEHATRSPLCAVLGKIMLKTVSSALALSMLAACAGVMPPARLYSPAERLQPGPWQSLDISGEAPYCTGMPYASQNASARQQALANIAKACGGEDKYHVVRETEVYVRFGGAGGLVETSCPVGAGRAILFKCAGDKTPPPKGR